MSHWSSTAKGIVMIVSAVAVFSIQNLTTKLISDQFSTHEILFIRALFMVPVVLGIAFAVSELSTLRTQYPLIHMGRSLALFFGFSGFFLGLSALPLANSIAIFFSAPLFVTILSVLILGEKIGRHRISAVCVGFAGVLVMVRPGFGDFNYATLFPLLGAMAYSCMPIITRVLGKTETAGSMVFYNGLFSFGFASIVGLVLGAGAFTIGGPGDPFYFLTRPWHFPSGFQWIIFIFLGITSGVGSYMAAQAYRTNEASTITPFEYTALFWATLWGFLVFGDVPDHMTLLGMALIVGAGLYIVARDAYLTRIRSERHVDVEDSRLVGNG